MNKKKIGTLRLIILKYNWTKKKHLRSNQKLEDFFREINKIELIENRRLNYNHVQKTS